LFQQNDDVNKQSLTGVCRP